MDGREKKECADDEANRDTYIAIFQKVWWKALILSLSAGLVTLIVMFQLPNIYQATAVITPAADEKKQNPALGALASFGLEIGIPSKIEDLESLFKSMDLTVRVFGKHDLWAIVLPDKFDPATRMIKMSLLDRLLGGEKGTRPPGDWDAIRAAKNRLIVSINRKSGNISISFEAPSAEGAANIVKYFLEEGKSRLQEEAFERAVRNKKFIEEQIGRTVDALTRDRLYTLYGQEVEREMLARNREQFGFKIIDSARVPDRKLKPHRATTAVLVAVIFFGLLTFLLGGRNR